MLSNEIMGLLAGGVLWVTTLLVAAAAWQQARALLRRRAALRPLAGGVGVGLVRGRVSSGVIAVQRLEQVGRAAEGREAILFHDKVAGGSVLGGAIAVEGGAAVEGAVAMEGAVAVQGGVTVEACAEAEVWVTAREIAEAACCPSAAAFAEALAAARRTRGFSRTIAVEVAEGREVFVYGRVEERDGGRWIGPAADGMLVATMDPRALLARKAMLAVAFIAGEIALAAACTAVALQPPVFGRVSTMGGAASLMFFLLVQPAGTALRDALLVPSRAFVRGRWKRGGALHGEAAGVT
jgi:hypothetical protein